ncbi:MAG: queuosine precursor transporter [Calditrichia bacterium]
MSNELLWLIFLILDFSMALVAIYFFGKKALFVIIAADIIVCNIQVLKIINLFGFEATLGNIIYGSIFLATDLLSEVYGKKEARKGVWLGFFSLIFMTISMQMALQFHPASSDFSQPALQTIFGFIPRITLASLVAYLLSQHHEVWAFHFWMDKTSGKYLWVRNNASTWISQAIDSVVFVFIAFYGVFTTQVFLSILFTTYAMKLLVAIMDTPVVYIGRWILEKHTEKFGEETAVAEAADEQPV